MRKLFIIVGLLTLTACATPQQSCVSQARGELSALTRQIKVAEGNIARGYALHKDWVERIYVGVCTDSEGAEYPCEKTDREWVETPVAIDVREERRKVAGLKQRIGAVRAQAEAAVAQCQAVYPE